jgi:hypothetical protein
LKAATFGLLVGLVACGSPASFSGDYSIGIDVTPAGLVVGQPATVDVRIGRGEADDPWPGARLDLEAHMSHPGMAPIVVPLGESGGTYRAPVTFTMAGEWVFFVSGTLPDGRRIRNEVGRRVVTAPR